MKTLISRSFLIALLFAAFSGCEIHTADAPQNRTPEIETLTIARTIGMQHNVGLDFILNNLKKRAKPFQNNDEVKEFFAKSIFSFLETQPIIQQNQLDWNIDFNHTYTFVNQLNYSKNVLTYDILNNNSAVDLHKNVYSHIQKLVSVFQNGNEEVPKSESGISSRLDALNYKLDNEFSAQEIVVIQTFTETLKYSYGYWQEKRTEWIDEFVRLLPSDYKMEQKYRNNYTAAVCLPYIPCVLSILVDWEAVAIADGGGIIAGAAFVAGEAAWLAIWGSTPQGWLAAGGIVAGTTAAASALSVYNQILEYF